MSDVGLSSFETTTIVFGLLAGVATLILWVPRSLLRGPAA